jgi:hypothetical protein
MKSEVAAAIAELQRAFPSSTMEIDDDGQGGALFTLRGLDLGERYVPRHAWLGAHIPAQYPYADIYPVFMDPAVRRADGRGFEVPVTLNAHFNGRPAIQISRRNNHAHMHPQTAVSKMVKILDFLENLP